MYFTKTIETEIRQVYDAFWENLLAANAEVMEKIISRDFRQIGTTEAEVFFDKARFLVFMKETASQIVGNMHLRNRVIKIEPLAGLALVTEQNDVYVRSGEEWIYYSKCRISTVLQKEEDGWKLMQQHLSVPDAKAGEGETIALERISRENLELRDAIKRRTVELEQRNRELEIEASLEKVRSQALQMEKADNLMDICQIVYQELKGLGFLEIRNAMINIYEKESVFFLNYDYAPGPGKTVTKMPYNFHPLVEKQVRETKNADDAFSEFSFTGKELLAFRELRKRNGEQDDQKLDETASLHYYFYAIGDGSIGISTYNAISQEKLLLLKRFRSVFDFAYGRYQEIRQAEVQVREAKIEAALERVRSRSLAMHHSTELSAVVDTLLQEFTRLDFNLTFCIINLINGDDRSNTVWAANPETGKDAESYYMKFEDYDFHRAMWNAWKAQDKRFVYTLEGEEKKVYDEYLYTKTEFKRFPRHVQEANKALERYVAGFTFFEYSGLQTVSVDEITEADLEVLERFGKVFEQSYIRFLDLQKAEEQAREAQIEASLERIRSVSMAMRKSDELFDIIRTVFGEWKKLGVEFYECNINLLDRSKKEWINWGTGIGDATLPKSVKFQWFDDPIVNQLYEDSISGISYRTYLLEGDIMKHFLDGMYAHTDFKYAPEEYRKELYSIPKQFLSHAFMKYGSMDLVGPEEPPAPTIDILKRFAKVFEQAYTRYLDVVNAEAQAKESQIQLALERVRARTMAMHQSDELRTVVALLFEQMNGLGFEASMSSIVLLDKETRSYQNVVSSHIQAVLPQIYHVPYFEDAVNDKIMAAFEEGVDYKVIEFEGIEKKEFEDKFFSLTDFRSVPEETKQMLINIPHCSLCFAFMKYGSLEIMGDRELSADQAKILQRFAKVFEQTYTRFLDLQKAEAQTREAQIEVGLEKIRSRAMAMQHSSEIGELVGFLFEELTRLDVLLARCIIWVFDPDTLSARIWMANSEERKSADCYLIQRIRHPYYDAILEAWEKRIPKWVYELEGDDKRRIDEILLNQTDLASLSPVVKQGILTARHTVVCGSFNNFGFIEASGPKALTDEQLDILHRFSKVFDLTYTRVNDLEQAEAQARESRVQLALERVRAQAMAMHHSKDLRQVVKSLFTQLADFGMHFDGAFIFIFNRKTKDIDVWISTKHMDNPLLVRLPFDEEIQENPIISGYWKAIDIKGQVLNRSFAGKVKDDYFRYADGHNEDVVPAHIRELHFRAEQWTVSYAAQQNSLVAVDSWSNEKLSEEDFEVIVRCSGVFEQAYVRFLDLKKAEAQAREAEIQLALERVRARAMAMQRSEELSDVAELLFQKINELGVKTWTAGFNIWSDDNRFYTDYITNPEGGFMTPYNVDLMAMPVGNKVRDARISGAEYFVNFEEGEALAETYRYLVEFGPEQFTSIQESGFEFPSRQYEHFVFGSKVSLMFITYEAVPEEWHTIFKRFGAVFEQTYTRFLDLQKAEAQARDAQIEAALERVRAKVMAMNNSKDLDETSLVFGEQLRKLGIDWQFSYFWLVDETKDENTFWITWPDFKTSITIYTLAEAALYFNECLVEWRKGTRIHDNFVPKPGVQAWLDTFQRIADDAGGVAKEVMLAKNFPDGVYYYDAMMKYGSFGICINKPATDEQKNIQCRFAVEFERAYTRFLDLKTAETQAHRARIETALERVRARALAMQEPEELVDVARVLRQEMGQLGVEALETGTVFIHDMASENAECWFAIRDQKHADKKLVADHIRLDLKETWVGKQMFDFFEKDDVQVSIPMRGRHRKEWIEYCYGLSSILDGYYGAHIPDRVYHLYKFSNGAIGAAAPGDISVESWELLQRTASVFSLAYSRFRDLSQARTDLQRLKEEKHRAETALLELRTTQAQLIQSEKMASLGELTAGIAHEIQNPLNFVNNFSELSNELIDEMQEEMEKGNASEALKIATDIQGNLEKINLHGKRADAIVKNMLQHSRTSGTEKEPTDINALADEYLRLAYHGYRAKDKLFNATMEVDFDPDLGKIMVVPQDIGRVLLNLYNNAFYAVDKKAKAGIDGYLPAIAVRTRRQGRGITIEVRDNGDGIPDAIRDKIFQPFFTTKPTGQGTGLGLSLSYDIVTKGHGGEIEIQSEEGRGTSFMLRLPVL